MVIVAVFHIDIRHGQYVIQNIFGIHVAVDEDAKAGPVGAETAAGIDIDGMIGFGYETKILKSGMAFVIDATGKPIYTCGADGAGG